MRSLLSCIFCSQTYYTPSASYGISFKKVVKWCNIDGNEINPEKDPYQAIFTFLICDEITDWNPNIALEIKE